MTTRTDETRVGQRDYDGLAFTISCSYPSRDRGVLKAEIAHLRRKVRRKPQDAYALFELGKKLDQQGRRDAVTLLRRACRLEDDNPDFHQSLGEALLHSLRPWQREPKAAVLEFETALRLCRRKLRKRPDDADLFFTMGRTLYYTDQNDKAVEAYRKAIALRPTFAEAHWELSLILMRDIRRVEEFVAELQEAVRLKPESEEYALLLAASLSDSGDHAGAVIEYRKAVRLNPANAESHWCLGVELDGSGNSAGADAEFREAERLDPEIAATGQFNRGGELLFHGNIDGAIEELSKSVKIFPLVCAWNALGVAYHKEGNLGRAIAAYRKALRVKLKWQGDRWEHRYPLNNLGIALEGLGDFKGALREFRTVLRIDRNYVGMHNKIGHIFEKTGELRKALKQYAKEIEAHPDCEACRVDYAKLSERLASRRRIRMRLPPSSARVQR